jgi:hypothetical protein
LWQEVDEAISLRQQIEAKPVSTPQDQKEKENLLAKANAIINDLRDRANLLISSYLADVSNSEKEALRQRLLLVAQNGMNVSESDRAILPQDLSTFHWDLEFPEVFLRKDEDGKMKDEKEKNSSLITHPSSLQSGFHALVGNPPFMDGKKITGTLGRAYRDFLVKWLANGKKGSADLCAYFFLRSINQNL